MLETQYGEDPQGRRRFFGIYSAVVIDVNDPLNRSRIKVQVLGPTGGEITNWAKACLPVTSNSYHSDHLPHTASQIAALLTTNAASASGGDPQGGSVTVTIPALTIVAKSGAGTLTHHASTTHTKVGPVNNSNNPGVNVVEVFVPTSNVDSQENSKYADNTVPEHSFHRTIPAVKQLVWVMFEAGDPEFPVWIGVQS